MVFTSYGIWLSCIDLPACYSISGKMDEKRAHSMYNQSWRMSWPILANMQALSTILWFCHSEPVIVLRDGQMNVFSDQ